MNQHVKAAIDNAVGLLKPLAVAEGNAGTTLIRARGSTWEALKKAAEGFAAPLPSEARETLSRALATAYRGHYATKGAAKSAASQHAKAVYGLTRGLGNPKAVSLKSYLRGAFPATPKDTAQGFKPYGRHLTPETERALGNLASLAQKDKSVSDAIIFMAAHSDKIESFIEYAISTRQRPAIKLVK